METYAEWEDRVVRENKEMHKYRMFFRQAYNYGMRDGTLIKLPKKEKKDGTN